jgi:hypothetical protein
MTPKKRKLKTTVANPENSANPFGAPEISGSEPNANPANVAFYDLSIRNYSQPIRRRKIRGSRRDSRNSQDSRL